MERPASTSGLQFRLHPLVLISISDQCTRARLNAAGPSSSSASPVCRVFGCLLGEQSGREVDISNSFELRVSRHGHHASSTYNIDVEFMRKRADQYKQVFPNLDVVGWYSSSTEGPISSDLDLHAQISRLSEAPVYLVLDSSVQEQGVGLPVVLFETEVHVKDGQHSNVFVTSPFTVETSEAERVGVTQVAQLLPSGAAAGTGQLSAQVSGTLSALGMLVKHVRVVHDVLRRMAVGELAFDPEVARAAAALAARLPALDEAAAREEEREVACDVFMTLLAATVTKGSGTAVEMVDRFNLAYDRSGGSKRLLNPASGSVHGATSEPLVTP